MNELRQSVIAAAWFIFLTFPIMVIRVNTIDEVVEWRWHNMLWVGGGAFVLSFLWRYLLRRKEGGTGREATEERGDSLPRRLFADRRITLPALVLVGAFALAFPLLFSSYATRVMVTALIWVVLGLGLNIVVGIAGLLDLGYVAFYAVGAYSYALLNHHFPGVVSFWVAIPIGMSLAALFGILLGIPVLRLRGDYLAIVTLGFGEIIRLVLQNWNEFSFGPSGVKNIPRPNFFGYTPGPLDAPMYMYYLMIVLVLATVFVVNRLQDSRLGRSWLALREDEIACQAMGIDRMKTKLAAFALGATWAGLSGVIFAANTNFINPDSFTLMESIIALSVVVFGGMGSIKGVILGGFVLILLPETLREFAEYRMLIFGAVMVLMMIFRPQGLISHVRRTYEYPTPDAPRPAEDG